MRFSKKYLIVGALLIITICSFIFFIKLGFFQTFKDVEQGASSKIRLTVHVVYLLDQSVVTGATVEVVSSNGRVVSHQPLDDKGIANFDLPSGIYVVRMRSGYTGQVEIDLQSEKEVTLKVIPVSR